MNDIVVFFIGVSAGALAVFVPWIMEPYRKYVVNCHKTTCPHHGDENKRRLAEANDRERSKRPKGHIDYR